MSSPYGRVVWVEIPDENSVVTDKYMHTIGQACQQLGAYVIYDNSVISKGDPKIDRYIVLQAPSVLKLYAKGARHITFWSQGVWPEESYLRNHSRTRFFAASLIEKAALEKAQKVFAVSEQLVDHYEYKYHMTLAYKTIVVPCSNECIHRESFFVNGKYSSPTFVYIGSLAPYQCINETLDIYKSVKHYIPQARFLMLTRQIHEAQSILNHHGLNDIVPRYIEREQLSDAICGAKYGFVIRHDNVISQVSTPTKITTYLANGIIPIYSNCIRSFHDISNKTQFKIEIEQSDDIPNKIYEFEKSSIDSGAVYHDYKHIFRRYFDLNLKRNEICSFMEPFISA